LKKDTRRLAVTFVDTLLDSLNRWFCTYDHRDAQRRIEYLRESYDPETDAEAFAALPKDEDLLPPSMVRKPLRADSVKSVVARKSARSQVARLIAAVRELDTMSRRRQHPKIAPEIADLFAEANAPVPVLLTIFR
jgi:hypothetical protein